MVRDRLMNFDIARVGKWVTLVATPFALAAIIATAVGAGGTAWFWVPFWIFVGIMGTFCLAGMWLALWTGVQIDKEGGADWPW